MEEGLYTPRRPRCRESRITSYNFNRLAAAPWAKPAARQNIRNAGLLSEGLYTAGVNRVALAAGVVLLSVSCRGKHEPSPSPLRTSASATPSSASMPSGSAPGASISAAPTSSAAPASSASAAPAHAGTYVPDPKRYCWLGDDRDFPKPDASLEQRFAAPPGYVRVKVEPNSFAEWLRGLPMAPEGTPVKSFDGKETLAGDDDFMAGVVAIDVGSQDLQQSADVIIRLHAEYMWSRGEKDQISYRSATKLSLPLSRWEKGQRLIAQGPNVFWAVQGKPAEIDHAEFRRYLDSVFTWANSTSLGPRSEPVEDPKQLTAGDFFLQSQDVAIVLDIADKPSGERVALLAKARSRAESIHVLRPGKATAWFSVRPPVPVMTPRSRALAWSELRRMSHVSGDDK
jgi:hypothetical protein